MKVALLVLCAAINAYHVQAGGLTADLACPTVPAADCTSSCSTCLNQGLGCTRCGCDVFCHPEGAEQQRPLKKCSEGSIALQCSAEEAEAVCSGAACQTGDCKAYQCGDTCTAVCTKHASAGQPAESDEPSPSRRLRQTTSGTLIRPKEGEIICPDGVTPAAACTTPSRASFTCATLDCRDGNSECKLVSCPKDDGKGSECVPVCLAKDFTTTPGKCPAAFPEVQCTSNPCAFTLCKVNTECVVNNCGNCTQAECRPLDQSASQCADGTSPVNCFVDPCMGKVCGPDRQCASEYCGGCNSACIPKAPCSNGKTRRPCLNTASQCIRVRCGFGSTCVPDQCNDCAAVCVKPCPPGQFVNKDTASCTDCPLGQACAGGTEQTGTADPVPCNRGYYADKQGLAKCKKCKRGTTTPARPRNKGYTKCNRE